MKQMLKLVVVLTIFCLLSGIILAWVYERTKDPIEATEKGVKAGAVLKVLPDCDNDPLSTIATVEGDWVFYVGIKNGAFAGAAFESVSAQGYAGNIAVMVGIDASDAIHAVEVLPTHKETPGLGARITEDFFKNQFNGLSISETKWAVKKDMGDIDQITAATISSRAVVEAIKNGVDVYLKNKDTIKGVALSGSKEASQ